MFSNFVLKFAAAKRKSKPGADSIPQSQQFGNIPLTGNRKALLIGINYVGQQGQLKGCVNDVWSMENYIQFVGFPQESDNQLILVDEGNSDVYSYPTRDNIIDGMKWLVQNAQPGDSLFLHYSGHGTRVKDTSGDEADGYDEALVPLDFKTAGLLLDDDIHKLLVQPLPEGCRLTIVLDCCHSGSGCDLPFFYQARDAPGTDFSERIPEVIMNTHWDFKNFQTLVKQGMDIGLSLWEEYKSSVEQENRGNENRDHFKLVGEQKCRADIVMISGCKDSQTSADVHNASCFQLPSDSGPGAAGGACTNALLSVLWSTVDGKFRYVDLLKEMRKELKSKNFAQVPQLSCTKRIELSRVFSLVE